MLPGVELTIDDLAQRAGTTSRNIRAYQARGLIPPPELRGRTGYYGEEHLRRLELIAHLQERGFSLEAIRQTLDAWSSGGDLGHLIGFHHLLSAPWSDEEPTSVSVEELLAGFPEAAEDPALIDRALELDVIAPGEDGDFAVPSPKLLESGRELARAGVPLAEILELTAELRRSIAHVADLFVDVVATHVVEPVTEGRNSPQEVEQASESIRRLRPIAQEVARAFLAQELRRATDARVAEFSRRLDAGAADSA